MRRPELVLLVAVWEFITAFFAFIGLMAVVLVGFTAVISEYRYGVGMDRTGYIGALFGLSVATLILVIYIVISVTGGIGLLRGKEWGRIVSIVHAGLSCFAIPVGTIVGILTLIYLTRTEVRDYFTRPFLNVPPPAPPVPPPTNPAP
jgi:hypothetical protein